MNFMHGVRMGLQPVGWDEDGAKADGDGVGTGKFFYGDGTDVHVSLFNTVIIKSRQTCSICFLST